LQDFKVQPSHQIIIHRSFNPAYEGRKSKVLPEHVHS